jgi:predicted HTH transcriptional regulator
LVFEKVPLARHIPLSHFRGPVATPKATKHSSSTKPGRRARRAAPLAVPAEKELLAICSSGEDHHYEFKAPGVEPAKISKEIAAFLHTREGGIILYGVADNGHVTGSDLRRQDFDQRIQNSVRSSIQPAPHIQVRSARILGTEIIVIVVPPWDRKTVYYYDGRVYVRRGTNAFQARPDEIRRLYDRQAIG